MRHTVDYIGSFGDRFAFKPAADLPPLRNVFRNSLFV